MSRRRWTALAAVAGLVLAACGGGADRGGQVESRPDRVEPAPWTQATSLTPGTIVTVVGTGQFGDDGLGGPATGVELQSPVGLAFDGAGNLYIAERQNDRILKVAPSGVAMVVAGTGEPGFSGDGGPATEAALDGASGVAVGPDGNLYIADGFNNRIRMMDGSGVITTVAGSGEEGFSGDGGPATEAALNGPVGMAFDAEGNLYIHDLENYAVRMVDGNGSIKTLAGSGEPGARPAPDGTPATEAPLGSASDHVLSGLAFDQAGRLVFSDMGHARIWMIDRRGLLRTVAGNGKAEFSGDGGPATEAGLSLPLGITIGPGGILYIATHDHGIEGDRVRMVDRDGTTTTIAGIGDGGYSGDGGPASEAELNIPSGVAIGPDGNLYIADAGNNVIRMVAL